MNNNKGNQIDLIFLEDEPCLKMHSWNCINKNNPVIDLQKNYKNWEINRYSWSSCNLLNLTKAPNTKDRYMSYI